MPVRQILPDVVDVIDGLCKRRHPALDVLHFGAVEHGAAQKQRQALLRGFCNERVVAVVHQVQLGEYRQARVQQLADDARVGKGRGTHERRVKVPRCHRRRDALIRLDAQSPRFFPARGGEIHARQRRRRLHAPDEARTAFAHAAQTYDQKFHIISSPCRAVHSPLFNIGVSLPGANPAWPLLPARRLGAFRLCPRRPCGKTGPNAQSQHHGQRPGENEDAPRALSPRENQQHKLHQ